MDKYKVSVIIPIYNSEQYIERCIDSIVNQSLDGIEIICINDGSTDGTEQVLVKYANKPNITVVNKENEGVSVARNTGIAMAHGKYIGFVDSDDYIERDMYEKMYRVAEKYKLKLVICGCVNEYPNKASKMSNYLINAGQVIDKAEIREKIYPKLMQDSEYSGPCNKLYLYEFMNECNVEMPENISYGEDLVFQMEMYDRLDESYYIDEGLYHYVHRENSLTSKRYSKFESAFVPLYRIRCGYSKKWDLDQCIADDFFVYCSVMDFCLNNEVPIFKRIKIYAGNKELKKAMKSLGFWYKYTPRLYAVYLMLKIMSKLY